MLRCATLGGKCEHRLVFMFTPQRSLCVHPEWFQVLMFPLRVVPGTVRGIILDGDMTTVCILILDPMIIVIRDRVVPGTVLGANLDGDVRTDYVLILNLISDMYRSRYHSGRKYNKRLYVNIIYEWLLYFGTVVNGTFLGTIVGGNIKTFVN